MLEEDEEIVDYEDDEAEYEFTQDELDQNMGSSDPYIDAAYADALEEPMPPAPPTQAEETPQPSPAVPVTPAAQITPEAQITPAASIPTQAHLDSASPLTQTEASVGDDRSNLMDRLSRPLPDTSSETLDQDAEYQAAKRSRRAELAPGWRVIYPDAPYGEVSYYNEETRQTVYFKPVAHRYLDGEVATEVVQRPSKGHMKRAREAQRRALIAQSKAESASPLFNRPAASPSESTPVEQASPLQQTNEASPLQQRFQASPSQQRENTSPLQQRVHESPSQQSLNIRGTAQSQPEIAEAPPSPDSSRKRTAAAAIENGFSRGPVLFLGNDVDDVQPIVIKDEEGFAVPQTEDRPARSSPLASRFSNGASDASDQQSAPRSAFPPAKQVPVRTFSGSGSPFDQTSSSPTDTRASSVFTFRVENGTEL